MTPATGIALISAIAAVTMAAAPLLTGAVLRRQRRRATTGSVATSEAAQLWRAREAWTKEILSELTVTRQQRDRLLAQFEDRVLPVQEALAAGQKRDGLMLAEIMEIVQAILTRLEEGMRDGTSADAAPPAQPAG